MFRFQCVITVMSNVDHDNAHLGGPCRSVVIQSRLCFVYFNKSFFFFSFFYLLLISEHDLNKRLKL